MVFLELRRDSRVTTGNSGCLLCWPREVQSSIRVAKESWGLLSSDCRANRPHLGLCPEANVPLQGRQGSRGCIPDAPGEIGIPLEGDRYVGELCWSHQGCQVPFRTSRQHVGLLLRRRHGKGLHLVMAGEPRDYSRIVAGFSSHDGEFRMPLVLAQGSPIFHSSSEGELGITLESLQGK